MVFHVIRSEIPLHEMPEGGFPEPGQFGPAFGFLPVPFPVFDSPFPHEVTPADKYLLVVRYAGRRYEVESWFVRVDVPQHP